MSIILFEMDFVIFIPMKVVYAKEKIEGGMSMRGLKGIIVGDTARSASKQQPTPIFLPFIFFLSVFFRWGSRVERGLKSVMQIWAEYKLCFAFFHWSLLTKKLSLMLMSLVKRYQYRHCLGNNWISNYFEMLLWRLNPTK